MVAKGFIGERVEFARFCVPLDLAIPCGGIKLGKPPPKLCEFLGRESGDPLLQGFEFTHGTEDTTLSFRGLMFSRLRSVSGVRAAENAFTIKPSVACRGIRWSASANAANRGGIGLEASLEKPRGFCEKAAMETLLL